MRQLCFRLFWVFVIANSAAPCVGATLHIALKTGSENASANSAAIQTAIASAAGGDTVALPVGTFSFAESLQLKSGVSLAGNDAAHTTLVAAFQRDQPMISGSGVTHVDLHGFTLDGGSSKNVTQGVALEKSASLNLHDLAVVNIPGSDEPNAPLGPLGIDCTADVTKSTFKSIACRSIGVDRKWSGGIRLSWHSCGNTVANCTIENTGRGGIFCNDGSSDNIIVGNTVRGSGGVGLGIEVQNCDRSLIEHNKIDHWLSVDNSSMSAVRANTVSTSDRTFKFCGVEIVDSHDLIVSDNNINGGEKIGLSMSGARPKERMLISNNFFGQATTWGAQIQGEAGGVRDLYFDHNAFSGTQVGGESLYPNQGHGLRINGNAHALTFWRNEMTHNAGVGLQITGDAVDQLYFYKNVISENHGGVVESGPIKDLVWLGNSTPTTTPWAEHASQTPQPQIAMDVGGAKLELAGTDRWSATRGSPLVFKARPIDPFVPRNCLWDFSKGLPETTLIAEQVFDDPGVYLITMVSWDADGRAARTTAQLTVKRSN